MSFNASNGLQKQGLKRDLARLKGSWDGSFSSEQASYTNTSQINLTGRSIPNKYTKVDVIASNVSFNMLNLPVMLVNLTHIRFNCLKIGKLLISS